ncbi:MAG: choice-of-anchor L domain-containing protein [Bacteroidota bacterium]
MKKLLIISLCIFMSLSLFAQEKTRTLSTNPEHATELSTKQDLSFESFQLNPHENIELDYKHSLRHYYNQNYYFRFTMPENKDVHIDLRFPDKNGMTAGMAAYRTEKGDLQPISHSLLRRSDGTFKIHQSRVDGGETVLVRLWFSEKTDAITVDLALSEHAALSSSKDFIVDQNSFSVPELVSDVLLNNSVQVSNVSYTGDTISCGYYSGSIGDTEFNSGLLMTSGDAALAVGPDEQTGAGYSSSGGSDPDLQALIPSYTVNDATIIEFDFVANDNFMAFEYIFASEEFPEFANSSFNDVFGFFLSGPGLNGPFENNAVNIATLPNGDPVTIDNVYNNSEYYVGSVDGSGGEGLAYNNDMEYDGASIPLVAEANLWEGETYHIKLAIGDAGDAAFDSGVFFKGNSFNTGSMATGTIFYDTNEDGFYDSLDLPLPDVMVESDPDNFVAMTNSIGFYSLPLLWGEYTITPVVPPLFEILYPASGEHQINITSIGQEETGNDFALISTIDCPMLNVDISGEALSACNQTPLLVNYSNQGTVPAENAVISLELNENISIVDADISYSNAGNNLYIFEVGNLDIFESGSFGLTIETLCDTELEGLTLCGNAEISADNQCTFMNPGIPADTIADAEWDNSGIAVTGLCAGDLEACFTITNEGEPGNGDMEGPSEYRIYANDTLIYTNTFQLNGGESMEICWETDGRAIRLEADQRPGHPGNSQPQSSIEDCGDYTGSSLGYIVSTPLDDYDFYEDMWCSEVQPSGSKSQEACRMEVTPKGVGSDHYVARDTRLHYTIYFQNTSDSEITELAIRDSLPDYLNFADIEFTGSSHPCQRHISKDGIITWSFSGISLLPASSDEDASKGFVSFNIGQKDLNAYGTIIENSATVFFDKQLIFTSNETDVTVWELPLIITNKPETGADLAKVEVFPNPASLQAEFVLPGDSKTASRFVMYDKHGRMVRSLDKIRSRQFNVGLEDLSSGTYIYEIRGEGNIIGKGKLIIR